MTRRTFFCSGGDQQLQSVSLPPEIFELLEQRSDHRRVDELAPGEVDQQVSSDRGERERDLGTRRNVVFAAQEDDRRVAAGVRRVESTRIGSRPSTACPYTTNKDLRKEISKSPNVILARVQLALRDLRHNLLPPGASVVGALKIHELETSAEVSGGITPRVGSVASNELDPSTWRASVQVGGGQRPPRPEALAERVDLGDRGRGGRAPRSARPPGGARGRRRARRRAGAARA